MCATSSCSSSIHPVVTKHAGWLVDVTESITCVTLPKMSQFNTRTTSVRQAYWNCSCKLWLSGFLADLFEWATGFWTPLCTHAVLIIRRRFQHFLYCRTDTASSLRSHGRTDIILFCCYERISKLRKIYELKFVVGRDAKCACICLCVEEWKGWFWWRGWGARWRGTQGFYCPSDR